MGNVKNLFNLHYNIIICNYNLKIVYQRNLPISTVIQITLKLFKIRLSLI